MMDDGIVIYLARELNKHSCASNISYLVGESDIDYCLEQMEVETFVIILDAVFSGKKPGDLSIYPFADLHEHDTLHISPHNLHLFQALYQQKDQVKGFLIGVEPHEIKFHIGLSEPLTQKWELILEKVKEMIGEIMAKENA